MRGPKVGELSQNDPITRDASIGGEYRRHPSVFDRKNENNNRCALFENEFILFRFVYRKVEE